MAEGLKPWDGRKLCSLDLADAYPASECAVPVMGGSLVFQKAVTDASHPYSRRKQVALTYLEAASLADGRFKVALVSSAPSEESKTDKAKKASAVKGEE